VAIAAELAGTPGLRSDDAPDVEIAALAIEQGSFSPRTTTASDASRSCASSIPCWQLGIASIPQDVSLTKMRAPLTIAAAQPACVAKDVRKNALEHAQTIRAARARVVVFPELSLTGYELDADAVPLEHDALTAIADACAETETLALVGAPVEGERGGAQIGMLRVTSTGTEVVYGKSYLGGDELTRFTPGTGPVAIEVDGWRIGLGICKDTGVDRHIADTAALNVDLYVAGLVHLPEELDVQEERGIRLARTCGAYVAFASFAGPTGGGYARTAGASSIWGPDGTALARAGLEPGGLARATLT